MCVSVRRIFFSEKISSQDPSFVKLPIQCTAAFLSDMLQLNALPSLPYISLKHSHTAFNICEIRRVAHHMHKLLFHSSLPLELSVQIILWSSYSEVYSNRLTKAYKHIFSGVHQV